MIYVYNGALYVLNYLFILTKLRSKTSCEEENFYKKQQRGH